MLAHRCFCPRASGGAPVALLRTISGRAASSFQTKRTMAVDTGTSSLQKLYRAARAAFQHGRQPSASELAAELGLSADGKARKSPFAFPGRAEAITYQHIYEDEDMSIGIFCLPAHKQLPLHNHPGMTVLSRVLYGSMHLLSFDWEDAERMTSNVVVSPQRARQVSDTVIEASDEPCVLFPKSGGNIHQFTAVKPTAVLDVLAPPYDTSDEERDCTYFRQTQTLPAQDGPTAILEPCPSPPGFHVASQHYRGLPIIPDR